MYSIFVYNLFFQIYYILHHLVMCNVHVCAVVLLNFRNWMASDC